MSLALLAAVAGSEVRLRLRRLSTVVTLLAVVALAWAMIPDPAGGTALLALGEVRVRYTSSALALGSASLGGLLFSLAGFYLVRGRSAEDLRTGTGAVIAATPVSNARFLLARWLGGVAYLGVLVLAFLGSMLVCHALRGEGPLQPWVYLQTYALVLLPTLFLSVSCALLYDGFAPLMGKRGDVLFFLLWVAQLAMVSGGGDPGASGVLPFDFAGVSMALLGLQAAGDAQNITVGLASFDPRLPALTLPAQLWTGPLALARLASAALALLPLLPAVALFHRYSPDRVSPAHSRRRRSPLDLLNGWLRPLSKGVQPLFRLGALLPGLAGQVVADVALTLTAAPAALLALLLLGGASLWAAPEGLGGLLAVAVAFWGVLVSDLSTRDYQANTLDLTGAVPGGGPRRALRQLAAAFVLGLLFTGAIAARWAATQPVRALAVGVGVFCLSALASLLGRLTNTARTFTALFLFGLYVALNTRQAPLADVVGFNGAATVASVLTTLAVGLAAAVAGLVGPRARAR